MRNSLLNLIRLNPLTVVGKAEIHQLLTERDVDPLLIDWIFEAIEKARAAGYAAGYEEGRKVGYVLAEQDFQFADS